MRRYLRSFGLALATVLLVLLVPQRGEALNPVHTCASCHNLHGGFGELIKNDTYFFDSNPSRPDPNNQRWVSAAEATCLTCHSIVQGTTTQPAAIHEQNSWATFARYIVDCLDCHNPHSDQANWLGAHTEPPASDVPAVMPPVPVWQPNTAYSAGDYVVSTGTATVAPPEYSARKYRNTTAGTSGVTEPDWNASIDGTTNDGTAVWTAEYLWTPGMNMKLIGWPAPSGTTDMWSGSPWNMPLPAGAAVVWAFTYDPTIVPAPPATLPCTHQGNIGRNDIPPAANECYVREWRRVVFENRGEPASSAPWPSHSFAEDDMDANGVRDGICETCHTANSGIGHHYNDGLADGHNDGDQCTRCHVHDNGFIK